MTDLQQRAAEDCARLANEKCDGNPYRAGVFYPATNRAGCAIAFRTFREQAHTVAEQVEAWIISLGIYNDGLSELRAIIAPLKLPPEPDWAEEKAREVTFDTWEQMFKASGHLERVRIIADLLRQAKEARDGTE